MEVICNALYVYCSINDYELPNLCKYGLDFNNSKL